NDVVVPCSIDPALPGTGMGAGPAAILPSLGNAVAALIFGLRAASRADRNCRRERRCDEEQPTVHGVFSLAVQKETHRLRSFPWPDKGCLAKSRVCHSASVRLITSARLCANRR